MTFHIDSKGPLFAPRTVGEDVSTGFGEYMGEKFADMWDSNPVPSIDRQIELTEATYGKVVYTGDAVFGLTAEIQPPSPPLEEEEQKRRFADAGLEAHLKPHKEYTPEAVDILIDRKKTELARQDAIGRASNWYAPFGIVAGLGAAVLDPLNVASAFIPVVGEARLANMLGRRAGALGRAGVRAGVGAVDGVVGAALMEPFTASAKFQEQADYGMTDAMLNVGFGAFFGAGLHAGGGMIGDAWRSARGAAQPWEAAVTYAPEATDALRADFRTQLQTAHPHITPEQAGAASALFDARARTWGRDFLRAPGEYYERYAPEFLRGGKSGSEPGVPRSEYPDGLAENTSNRQGSEAIIGSADKKGNPLEQSGDSAPRASIAFAENGKAVVRFFESADVTSAPHELFHIFRRELAESAASPHAPAHVRRDWQQVMEFVGAKEGETWTTKMEEAFAREGEAFLLHGKAPSPELVGVFARLKEWFVEVYRSIRGEMNVSPAMREIFERMLATTDAADRGVAELIRAMDRHPRAAQLREAYAKLTPEERQEVFQVALAQAHQGLPIDVEALVLRDAEGVRAAAEAPELEAARVRDELSRTPEADAALRDATEELESSRAALEQSAPELRQELDAELAARLAEHDAVVARIDLEEKALLAAAECDMRR